MKDPFKVAKNHREFAGLSPVIVKVCSCGFQHTSLPPTARKHIDPDGLFSGIYFDCHVCMSTNFIPDEKGAA